MWCLMLMTRTLRPITRLFLSAALALSAAGGLTGCGVGQSPQSIVAHKIADALPRVLGPAAHYDVQVTGGVLGLAQGRAKHVHITGQDVRVTPTVTLDTLTLDADDISFNEQTHTVQKVGKTVFAAALGQAHLSAYLAQARPNLQVTLLENSLQAALPIHFGPLQTVVTVRGTLAPTEMGSDTVGFIADRARLGVLPVPAFAVNAALEAVNPVLDLSQVKVPIAVQSADVEQGLLTLRGTAQIDSIGHAP